MAPTDVTATILARLSFLPVPIQKLVNQSARLQLIERLNCRAEHFASKTVKDVLVEVVFFSDLFDQFPLFLRTVPSTVLIHFHAVAIRRNKSGLLDMLIDCLLQRIVQPSAFFAHAV